jgi:hypothetical protein
MLHSVLLIPLPHLIMSSDLSLTGSLQCAFILDRVGEILGHTSNAQLRLVSRWFRQALPVPQQLKVADYLSPLSLFLWARQELHRPRGRMVAEESAQGGHLPVLQWLRGNDTCTWTADVCRRAAEGGQLEVLQWLRTQSPPCPWDGETCIGAALHGHLGVLQWLRAQDPPCPWDGSTVVIDR